MTVKLHRYSEAYSPTGSFAATGVRNQLGRSPLDPLAVLVRETVQNSWDARLDDNSPIKFGVAVWTLDTNQRNTLTNQILTNCPPQLPLMQELNGDLPISLMAIYDRGTEGLSGPTRADAPVHPQESRNFVDFLRNVGQAPDKRYGGGTYGFGKAALYLASCAQTIIVHTHCLAGDLPISRLICAALGDPYSDNVTSYTGRHWWGIEQDGIAEPITAPEAETVAHLLGFPVYQQSEFGTSVVIVQPRLYDFEPQQVLQRMIEHVLWNFWPKMLNSPAGKPYIQFEFSLNNVSIPVPDPTDFPPLQGFVQAMNRLKQPSAESGPFGEKHFIESPRYKQKLGELALERFVVKERPPSALGEWTPISANSHHVALMRQAELVVRYLAGPELQSDQIEYAGVFKTDAEVDDIFAKSEPPTHDNWVANDLDEKREKSYVNVALDRIKERLKEFTRPLDNQFSAHAQLPLGGFANRLGGLFPTEEGPSASALPFHAPQEGLRIVDKATGNSISPDYPTISTQSKGENESPRTREGAKEKPRVMLNGVSELVELENGAVGMRVLFLLSASQEASHIRLKATVSVLLDGGNVEKDPPVGGALPSVIYWEHIDSKQRFSDTSEIAVSSGLTGNWEIVIEVPDLMATTVSLQCDEVNPE